MPNTPAFMACREYLTKEYLVDATAQRVMAFKAKVRTNRTPKLIIIGGTALT